MENFLPFSAGKFKEKVFFYVHFEHDNLSDTNENASF